MINLQEKIFSFSKNSSVRHLERASTKFWKQILLENEDTIIIDTQVMQMHGKNIGAGVWKITRPVNAGETT